MQFEYEMNVVVDFFLFKTCFKCHFNGISLTKKAF